MLFSSLAGQKIEQEAHQENGFEPSVASSTHAMEKVSIVSQSASPTPMEVVAPPPAPPAKPQSPQKAAPSPVKAQQTTPAKAAAPKEEEAAPQAGTPPRTPTRNEDVAMEEAEESKPAAPVPFTPSKPIEQMTVAALRDELKRRGLSIKGLKAELVQRLKEATGA